MANLAITPFKSNIHEKLREYMVLRMIGIEQNGLFKVVMYQSLYYAVLAVVFRALGGLLFSWILVYYLRLLFVFPWYIVLSTYWGLWLLV
ncbi:FtsX-like permease family protein [Desulfoscipio sp. XC116]|uniref:FtsX-like permease family protein n=1 Tax=Desulfoscipio sp. XC116 TaxID=3144975 RepID=UPI00325AA537